MALLRPSSTRPELNTFHPRRASELLAEIAADARIESVALGELVDRLDRRGFGILLFLCALPALLPTPVGAGAIAGPLVILCGVQLALGLERPWLPGWLRGRRLARVAAQKFLARAGHWLARIERLARPRWGVMLGTAGRRLIGTLVIAHGIALALPIPFTNYPLAAVLMVLAVALMEEDGLLAAAAAAGMAAAVALLATGAGAALDALWQAPGIGSSAVPSE